MNEHVRVRPDVLPASCPPRGLRREEAAAYVRVSPSKFDECVIDGRMPRPRRIDGVKVWDRRDLDLAFDRLPYDDAGGQSNSWADR